MTIQAARRGTGLTKNVMIRDHHIKFTVLYLDIPEFDIEVEITAENPKESAFIGAQLVVPKMPIDIKPIQSIQVTWPMASFSFLELHNFFHYDDLDVSVFNVTYVDDNGHGKNIDPPETFTGFKELGQKEFGDEIYDMD